MDIALQLGCARTAAGSGPGTGILGGHDMRLVESVLGERLGRGSGAGALSIVGVRKHRKPHRKWHSILCAQQHR